MFRSLIAWLLALVCLRAIGIMGRTGLDKEIAPFVGANADSDWTVVPAGFWLSVPGSLVLMFALKPVLSAT